ncbi:MAG: lysylphosphatidylglycerol synthase transmembrane domain-containing protein, partial [Ilumatobacter sp.]|nr:lysylphosphatidylglycerol synthase transmembrane domain-containing protein [Ilumatobacter sp.]
MSRPLIMYEVGVIVEPGEPGELESGMQYAHDKTHEMDREGLPTGELAASPQPLVKLKPRIRPVRFGVRMALFALIIWFAIGLLPKFVQAASELRNVSPVLLVVGFALEIIALFFYSLLTRAALGEAGASISGMRMFRIQLSTKALTNVVPGGNAAGSALGYRLLTLSGIRGPDAGFALATAGIGSAVVLNLVFWVGLIVSIPRRGVNPVYGTAALTGIIVIGIAAFLVIGIMEGQGRSEQFIRWIARKLRVNEDRLAGALHQIAERLEELISDRALLKRVVIFALLNWLFDAAALWVFLRAFGGSLDIDALIVAFGFANLLAAVPITPGGLGYVDIAYVGLFISFGLTENVATLGVAAYRFAQFFFPIFLGAVAYASLRVGPWKIERRDRLGNLRDLARTEAAKGETKIDFALRWGRRAPVADVTATTDGVELVDNADLHHVDLAAPAELRVDDHGQEKGEARFGSDSDPGDTLP